MVYTYDANISISTRNLRVNQCDASISALCLRLHCSGLHVRQNDASISTSAREWNDFHSLGLVLMLASLRRTCKPERCKHKHKRKERKLKNSDILSAYILVTHALPFSVMLESNLAPKGSPARACAKFLCFCACVCHVRLMLIAHVNILVLMLMLASYV